MNLARERCNAITGEDQCRATTKLTRVRIAIPAYSIAKLPDKLVVLLCPKHFKIEWPGGVA